MAKKRVLSKRKIFRFFLILLLLVITGMIIGFFIMYHNSLQPVSTNGKEVSFPVEENSTLYSLSSSLKEKKLIRSEFFYKLYIKLNQKEKVRVGTYTLSSTMPMSEIVDILGGKNYQGETLVTFREGLNMNKIISIIAQHSKNTPKEIKAKLKDNEFLDRMIQKYWFLTNDIKNPKIYYSLEGYLFPDSYNISYEDTIEDIFIKMLDNTEKKLEKIKSLIQSQKYSIHKMFTLASIVEAESPNAQDRKKVAGVFFNRIRNNMALGSDVTTYYSIQIDMTERDLYQAEIDDCNDYNTRCATMKGLPVGPVNNPGIESIIATLQPSNHDYLYFVADKNKKTYYSKNYQDHQKVVARLKELGLWYTY